MSLIRLETIEFGVLYIPTPSNTASIGTRRIPELDHGDARPRFPGSSGIGYRCYSPGVRRLEYFVGQSLQNQGIQLLKAGQYDAAATCFEQLIRQHPDNAHVFNLLGITRSRQGNYPEALALMTKAITLDGSSAEIHHNIGPIYRVIGDFEQAENHYREAIRLKPDYAEAYFNLASVKTFATADPHPRQHRDLDRG